MGAKTGLLVYADGDVPDLLRQVDTADPRRTSAMMARLYPGREFEETEGLNLCEGVYPPDGTVYAGAWPGVEVVCDREVMVDFPSRLPEHLVAAGAGRRLVLHAMHSVVGWCAFAVWEDGHLVRSLSLSPEDGIIEDIGEPLPFERPYWAGERPAEIVPWPGEEDEPYPLPFHPLEFGEQALRALCGFVIEGRPRADDVDAMDIGLHGFLARDPDGRDRGEEKAEMRRAVAAMGPPRFYTFGPDGSLVERRAPWDEAASGPGAQGVAGGRTPPVALR
ncbi:DUF6928 family protein [Streptomyces sp. NPDC058864]